MYRIGLDIDGVLRDIEHTVASKVKELYPMAKHITNDKWNLHERYEGVPKNLSEILFKYHAEDIFYNAPPYEGALEFVEELQKIENTKIVIVTKQGRISGLQTLRWLARYKVTVGEIHLVRPSESKVLANCNLLIDDSTKNLEEQQTAKRDTLCVARPWNKTWEGERFKNYKDLVTQCSFSLYSHFHSQLQKQQISQKIK